jgi:Tol biopolymer transport system component
MDIERRVPHRLTSGVEQYTSLAASADGRHVIATASAPERTLWRVAIASTAGNESPPTRITLATGTGFGAREGPDYLLYVSAAGTGESIWKIAGAAATQLWSAADARIVGSPAVSADGRTIAFSVKRHGQTLLYTMASDGSRTRLLSDSLEINGAPAWTPDGLSITAAIEEGGVPHLYRIPVDGSAPTPLLSGYSVDPTWSPDGRFVVYSGPDIGTKFTVNAVTAEKAAYSLPALTLTRGARHLALLPGGRRLVYLQGEIQHKNLWVLDLESGTTQQLTHIPPDFEVRDFDISPDGREAVLERAQARTNIIAIDRSSL